MAARRPGPADFAGSSKMEEGMGEDGGGGGGGGGGGMTMGLVSGLQVRDTDDLKMSHFDDSVH